MDKNLIEALLELRRQYQRRLVMSDGLAKAIEDVIKAHRSATLGKDPTIRAYPKWEK